jgi:hypothetical protein
MKYLTLFFKIIIKFALSNIRTMQNLLFNNGQSPGRSTSDGSNKHTSVRMLDTLGVAIILNKMVHTKTKASFNLKEHAEKGKALEADLEKIRAQSKLLEYHKFLALKAAGPLAPVLKDKQKYLNGLAFGFMRMVTDDTSMVDPDQGLSHLDSLFELWQIIYDLPERVYEEYVTDNDFMN